MHLRHFTAHVVALSTIVLVIISCVGCQESTMTKPDRAAEEQQAEQVAPAGSGQSVAKRPSEATKSSPITIPPIAAEAVRFATFNMALNRREAGGLVAELEAGSEQACKLAAIVQVVRPEVLLVNELDFDEAKTSMELLHSKYFEVSQQAAGKPTDPITYPHRYTAPVNTGVPIELDLDGDGKIGGPTDCYGFGAFPGQYGMAVYSQYPIKNVRTFQKLLWKSMPEAALPLNEGGTSFYSEEALDKFRLSSKSHWDVEIETPAGLVHFLASHPTPPVFDGPEDRNGRRNHDEIRLFADYISGGKQAAYIVDDEGESGGLEEGARFVIAGDLNADPKDGANFEGAIRQLLDHECVAANAPESPGAAEVSEAQGGKNASHQSPASQDTGDFGDRNPGNLRADYVLPSATLEQVASGVFWPAPADPHYDLATASDHRLVWIDVKPFAD